MFYKDSDILKWGEQEITKAGEGSLVEGYDYVNPPKLMTLRGVEYKFLGNSWEGGPEQDGLIFWLVTDGKNRFWVSESMDGKFSLGFIKFELKNNEYFVNQANY